MLKLLLFISFLPCILSCGLIKNIVGDLLTLEAQQKHSLIIEQSFTSVTNRQVSLPLNISTDFSKELSERGETLESFSEIIVTSVELEILSPTGKNFNFLKDISFEIGDEVIANLLDVPNNQNPIGLNSNKLNLTSFISNDNKLNIEMTFEFLETIEENYNVELTLKFDIKANVL